MGTRRRWEVRAVALATIAGLTGACSAPVTFKADTRHDVSIDTCRADGARVVATGSAVGPAAQGLRFEVVLRNGTDRAGQTVVMADVPDAGTWSVEHDFGDPVDSPRCQIETVEHHD